MSSKRPINKILIANRSEIARRVIRTCKKLGIRTVAVFSEADKDALHVKEADEAIYIGKSEATESYLNGEKIIAAAKQVNADYIHPGIKITL
jgi:acetyl/propionyl-CoA carboxylase alpha subunit